MHKAVLLHESIELLNLEGKTVFVDATYGAGGHTSEVLKRFPNIQAISIDQDPETQANIIGNFREIDQLLIDEKSPGLLVRPDAILFDLGFSSDQLEGGVEGLSFQREALLDMRLSRQGPTAADILNSWDESAIELILRGFGEEKFSKKIASAIIERRKVKPFETTKDLVEAILAVRPRRSRDKINPATKTFQALRIAVNSELDALEEGLAKAFETLAPGGRLAVISFHSLEDRLVKNFFRDQAKKELAKLVTKKPVIPTDKEIKENPRSRSAKLRIIEKL